MWRRQLMNNSDDASAMKEQLLKDLFADKYIEDNGFSEQFSHMRTQKCPPS